MIRNETLNNRGMDGLYQFNGTFTYQSATQFQSDSFNAQLFQVGNKIQWVEGGSTTKNAFIIDANVSGSNVNVDIVGDSLTNTTFSDKYISNGNLEAHPGFFSYTPTASSTMTLSSGSVVTAAYSMVGDICNINLFYTVTTSGTASNSITLTLPTGVKFKHALRGVAFVNEPSGDGVIPGIYIASATGNTFDIRPEGNDNYGLGSVEIGLNETFIFET